MNRIVVAVCVFIVSLPLIAETLRIPGRTAEARVAYLRGLPDTPDKALDVRVAYLEVALKDPAPEVRSYAASQWFGHKYIGPLTHLLANDPDPGVRESAAWSLSSRLTDNGVDTCTGAEQMAAHVDTLLRAAGDLPTAEPALNILGFRDSGGTPLPCCMPQKDKERVLAGLANVADKDGPTAKHLFDQLMHSKHGGSFSFPGMARRAMENILACPESSEP